MYSPASGGGIHGSFVILWIAGGGAQRQEMPFCYHGRLSIVNEVEEWCFDKERIPGDCEVIAASNGVYVLYYMGYGDKPQWYACAEADLLSSKYSDTVKEIVEKYTITSDKDKIALIGPNVVF